MTWASVIVPARNAADTLEACLDALASEGVPGHDVELIVVDDGSTDATRAVAARPGVRVLAGMGHGPAAARNLGARAAQGETLIFLDADTAPRPGWLREMLAPLIDPGVAAVKGRYTSAQRSAIAQFAQLEFEDKYARLERARTIDFIDTGTAAFRRQVFLETGGFDEGFPTPSAEDVELGFRLTEQGAQLAFNPRAVVEHRHAEQLVEYLRKKARYGYYRVRVYHRHPRKTLGDAYTPPIMAVQIGLSGLAWGVVPFAMRRRGVERAILASLLAAFTLTTLGLARRAAGGSLVLAVCTPVLVFLRATAQGVGLVAGVWALAAPRRRPIQSVDTSAGRVNPAPRGHVPAPARRH